MCIRALPNDACNGSVAPGNELLQICTAISTHRPRSHTRSDVPAGRPAGPPRLEHRGRECQLPSRQRGQAGAPAASCHHALLAAVAQLASARRAASGRRPPAATARSEPHTPPPPQALRGATLRVPRGTLHFLLGPNGCGKSTLLRVAAGLILPEGGQVAVDAPYGFVFQNPDSQVVMPTAGADVAFGLGRFVRVCVCVSVDGQVVVMLLLSAWALACSWARAAIPAFLSAAGRGRSSAARGPGQPCAGPPATSKRLMLFCPPAFGISAHRPAGMTCQKRRCGLLWGRRWSVWGWPGLKKGRAAR
jgi:hypothetical protein